MNLWNRLSLRSLVLILAVVTGGAYWQTIQHGFCVFDDAKYVSDNPWVNEGLSWAAVRWAFTSFYASNWHPLTWLSHQADWSLYGTFAGGHHLTNLLLHTINTIGLFLLLRTLTGRTGPSWVVAALFGWHPLHVESVAWIAERKDLLSTLWLLGSVWAYSRYVHAVCPSPQGSHAKPARQAWLYLTLCFGSFAAGLLCKPMLVTLPCLLLLLDYWPLNARVQAASGQPRQLWTRLVLEKLPFFALSATACLITLAAQSAGGAVATTQQVPLALRAVNALSAYGRYLSQTLWPHPLCIFYPLPNQLPLASALVGALLVGGLSALAFFGRRRWPWLVTGWLWFLGSLVPVIGLVQVGAQAHADRYMYIPSIGLFLGLVWGLDLALGVWSRNGKLALSVAGAGLAACLILSIVQIGYWQDNVRLFTHALACTPNNAKTQDILGMAYSNQGKSQEAIEHYREAIRLQPANAEARFDLGVELANLGRLDEAAEQLTLALRLNPADEPLLNNLGAVLAQQGKYEQALDLFQQAMRLNPTHAKPYSDAGAAFQALGLPGPAVSNYTAALQLKPNSPETLQRLAFLLATCPVEPYHQPARAVDLARRATELTHGHAARALATLALAYAADGRYREAIAAGQAGLEIAHTARLPALLTQLKQDLDAYHARRNPERDWKLGQ